MATRFLDRAEASAYLAEKGLPRSPKTLQKDATVGGGPVYRRYGNKAVYTVEDLDSWVQEKLSPPRRTYDRSNGNTNTEGGQS